MHDPLQWLSRGDSEIVHGREREAASSMAPRVVFHVTGFGPFQVQRCLVRCNSVPATHATSSANASHHDDDDDVHDDNKGVVTNPTSVMVPQLPCSPNPSDGERYCIGSTTVFETSGEGSLEQLNKLYDEARAAGMFRVAGLPQLVLTVERHNASRWFSLSR